MDTHRRLVLTFGATALVATILTSTSCSKSDQRQGIPRVGFLSPASEPAIAERVEAFRQGLRELGYTEGKNILVEYRYADGNADRLSALSAELVRLNVDVVVTHGEAAIQALEQASKTIPIVVGVTGALVAAGREEGHVNCAVLHVPVSSM